MTKFLHSVYDNAEISYMYDFARNAFLMFRQNSLTLIRGSQNPVTLTEDLLETKEKFAQTLSIYGHDVFVLYINKERIASFIFKHHAFSFSKSHGHDTHITISHIDGKEYENIDVETTDNTVINFPLNHVIIHVDTYKSLIKEVVSLAWRFEHKELETYTFTKFSEQGFINELARIDATDNLDYNKIVSLGQKLSPLFEAGYNVYYLQDSYLHNMRKEPQALELYALSGRILIIMRDGEAKGALSINSSGKMNVLNNVWHDEFKLHDFIKDLNEYGVSKGDYDVKKVFVFHEYLQDSVNATSDIYDDRFGRLGASVYFLTLTSSFLLRDIVNQKLLPSWISEEAKKALLLIDDIEHPFLDYDNFCKNMKTIYDLLNDLESILLPSLLAEHYHQIRSFIEAYIFVAIGKSYLDILKNFDSFFRTEGNFKSYEDAHEGYVSLLNGMLFFLNNITNLSKGLRG